MGTSRSPEDQDIKNKWVFKIKHGKNDKPTRYIAKLVPKGYSQIQGINYDETFSAVARYNSIRMILAIANELSSIRNIPKKFVNYEKVLTV